ncbi:MAG: hypothetical protein J0H55_05950 [Chitinophagaceae bacterium]|nr:hypothetical protein [Chitinophagaceae bacterium]
MKKIIILLLTVLTIRNTDAQSLNPVRIGVITEGLGVQESDSVKSFLRSLNGVDYSVIGVDRLNQRYLRTKGIKEIWWIKDSEGVTDEERRVGKEMRQFVDNGGHLILSMEAVRLLNEWGIEKNRFEVKEDSVIDEGFGRPLGFHGYREHPVYDGLHGGAYIWKGETDNVVRKTGFFGNDLPDTSVCKVLGIGWSYITFNEDEKLVLEYRLGKGSIIAIGAYSYFSRPNLNQGELYRFYQNVFNYAAGNIKGVREGYWEYGKKKVRESNLKIEPIKVTRATRWEIPKLSLQLERKEGGNNFVNLTGRRMLLMGKEVGGIDEIWTHPFMAFRDVLTGIKLKGGDSIIWLNKLKPEIIVSPEMLIRKYNLDGDTLREVTTVSFDKPMGVVHYEWTGNVIERLYVKFTSNLRMMWPYSDTSSPEMSYQWSKPLNAALVRNEHAGSESLVGFSIQPEQFELGQFKDFTETESKINSQPTDLLQVSGFFTFDAKAAEKKFNVYLMGADTREENAIALYRELMPEINNLYAQSSLYYKNLLNSRLKITTPDKEFNEGYSWALVRTDQFLQTTPGIGTSMMAGFGTTARGWNGGQKISGRPGYAWYFGRDGEWTAMALDAMGAAGDTKKVLDMFVKYQAVNGKILHELTSSGAVHYDAADATPLFVVLAGHYLKYSGDVGYIKKIWPAIKKAMDFCYSTDTDHDGLIENTNVGHGWIEGGPLFGTHTEFYLAGTWAAALDEAAYMCKFIGNEKLMNQYVSDAHHVKEIIDRDFWSAKEKYFYNGKMPDGSFMKDATVLQSVPILLNAVTDPQKASEALSPLAKSDFSTDWGVRMISDDNPKFNPGAYHAGMVWPLFSGYASLAEYKTGNYTSAFVHMMNNISGYDSWALGSIVETLNGKAYKPNGVCYLQGWSETMCIQPAIEGMLGYRPDMMSGRVSLSPSFPADWDSVNVNNLRLGNHLFEMKFKRDADNYSYKFSKADSGTFQINFSPVLPLGTSVTHVWVNNREITCDAERAGEGIKVEIPSQLFSNRLQIRIEYKGGAGVNPIITKVLPGQENEGAKIISQVWKQNKFIIRIEGLSGKTVQCKLYSVLRPQRIENGNLIKISNSLYFININIPQNNKKWNEQEIILEYGR